ncbi:MAG: hypothetical protein WBN07_12125 [Woeseiaceae bacterium]
MHANPTRSLAISLLDRRWFTFVVELVLIIVGILAALTIDGWVTERENRASESVYLQSIARDLGQFESELKAQIEFEDGIIRTGRSAYDMLGQATPRARPAELGAKLTHLFDRRTVFLQSAAYTDIVSTGNLELIRDRALRDRLINYFASMDRSELVIEKNNSFFVDGDYGDFVVKAGLSPYPSGAWADAPPFLAGATEIFERFLGAQIGMPDDDVLFDESSSLDTKYFRRAVLWRTYNATFTRSKAEDMLAATVALRETLEEQLGQ